MATAPPAPPHLSAMVKLWATGDPTRLLHLARQIEAHHGWKAHLSPQEHEVFANAIAEGNDAWKNLISAAEAGKANAEKQASEDNVDSVDDPPNDLSPTVNGVAGDLLLHTPRPSPIPQSADAASPSMNNGIEQSNSSDDISELKDMPLEIDFVALALKVRYMLYEKSVDYLFATSTKPYSGQFEIDFTFLEQEDEIGYAVNGTKDGTEKERPPLTRMVDEDDYDDGDEEDDEVEEGKNVSAKPVPLLPEVKPHSNSATPLEASTLKRANEPEAKLAADGIITPADTPTAGEIKQADEVIQQEMYSLYQTLDADGDMYMKHVKVDENDSQEHDANNNAAGKLTQLNFGAAHLSLKHLLAAIDAKRQMLEFSDVELRNLISEVRKNRSKWASEDRVGQEELYEAAEKVVLELRAYTEHSTAFLNKVNKRDAPNYFNVIKNPMDLSTVMKKLKALQYRSKQEFVDDLMLIWNNCLTFNTDPQHYLRKHAMAMKKKTLSLIPLIPDIIIRSKSDVEAEESSIPTRDMSVDFDMESEDGDSFGPNHRASSRAASGGKHASKKAPPSLHLDDETRSRASQGPERRPESEDEQPQQQQLAFEYEVIPTMPEALWSISHKLQILENEQFETAIDLSSEDSPFLPSKSGLTSKMDANLADVQHIRKVCSKIGVIKRMQQQPHLYSTQLKGYNPEKINEQDVDMESRLPGHSDAPGEVAEACLRRSVAKLAMHTGYEDCQMLALEGLTAVAADFMQRLGRTLCLYMESKRGVRRFSLEDMVLQTLYENGTYDLGGLEGYVHDDIDRFGVKLRDVRERMNMSLADYLRPALTGDNTDAQFDDGSQEFISGGFSDDIGEDFFGFKELGLDEELGLSSLSVPLHLLHSRLHASSNVQATPVLQTKLASAPSFEPLARDKVDKQIGLLRPFFLSRFEKFERDNILQEDEFLPPKQRNQRPKLPPTGKITVAKKRSSENPFAGSDKKKKKLS
ncbi:hypothetical protein POJ06DRAFT_251612 [Lipomyces tetrasporus]|uniref:SAGA complex subunit Spt7 n=1 Tax=Lipomyces tetrasporus TaxID=54092 RepID=A0AAD7QU01_9ASCO|nr:uncharacterized protein POJ06DRAFT_251612 [Lipomyces tetrasporus]KAJ8101464.1 hypothetical protein POJ06DRAFT_251612 [Lipomyces tetrasporus]